jgi:growth factor-regulated tyrosine kinase substrate
LFSLQSQAPPARSGKTEAEIREEEELQLALALSKSEAEEKEKKKIQTTNQLLAQSNSRRSNAKEEDREPQRQQLVSTQANVLFYST